MALASWQERCRDISGPKPVDVHTFAGDAPIGGNNPTVVMGRIYDTPGNTPLNRAQGRLFPLPGRYTEQDQGWLAPWFKGSNWNPTPVNY